MFTSSKSNQKADILTRREQDVTLQEQIKRDSRSRVLLSPERLDPLINTELTQAYLEVQPTISNLLALIMLGVDSQETQIGADLIADLLADNRSSFQAL